MLSEVFHDPARCPWLCRSFCSFRICRCAGWSRSFVAFGFDRESVDESFVLGGCGVLIQSGTKVCARYGRGWRTGICEVVCRGCGHAFKRTGSGGGAASDCGGDYVVACELSADLDSGGWADERGWRYGLYMGALFRPCEGSRREFCRHCGAVHDSLEEAGRQFVEG
jgi:hypothetical protein